MTTPTATRLDADLMKDCPVCDGSCETSTGRRDPDTGAADTVECWFCEGRGVVDIDAYACTTCHAVILDGETCEHTGVVLCRDCSPRCHGCYVDELDRRAEQAADWDRQEVWS